MRPTSERTERVNGIAGAIGQMADGLGRLFTEHVALARIELSRDAKFIGSELGRMAVFAPLVIVGYAFVCGALALALSRAIGPIAALILVGGFNLVIGAVGLSRSASRLRVQPVMRETLAEVSQSVQTLSPPPKNGHPGGDA